jgi:YrbI family 3-deoxy-D-manno-octulosonate 8-phosphate phosphatase
MNVLAIIPARGDSKGIPHKNIKPIAGLPLIAWNIRAALSSDLIARTIVSTDDAEIGKVAKQYGAELIWRPKEISGDEASSESALLHVLNKLCETEQYTPDLLVFLQCTSPLTMTIDIDNCIRKLLAENADSATTVSNFHYFIWGENDDNSATGINHDKSFRPRRQDRESQYLETGAVYVMKTKGFLKHHHRFFGKTVLSEMPEHRVLEIDHPIDLIIAEIRLRDLTNKQKSSLLPKNIKAIVFDFDGVMTNNKVFVTETETEVVRCDRGDGMGINQLKKQGYQLAVMSTETNPVVSARCNKLGIECYQSLGNSKFDTLKEWCTKKQIELQDVVFVGNDINDIDCLKNSGCSVVPADAHESVLPFVKIILNNKGGEGAIRELCDMIINL